MAGEVVRLFRFWWALDAPVNRRTYAIHGFSLALAKYLGDVLFFVLATGRFWKPTDYLQITHSLMWTTLPGTPEWFFPMLGVWTLPFLWIGISLTIRRTLDASVSPWWTMCFFVPYVNYALMGTLCILPSKQSATRPNRETRLAGKRMPSALLGIAAGVALGIVMVDLGVRFKDTYGFFLFLGAPFGMGAITAFLFNRRYAGTFRETIQVTVSMFICVAGVLFLLAFEGGVCIAMAIPLGLLIGLLGAAMGRAIALWGQQSIPPAISAMLLLPICLFLEPANLTGHVLHEVQSSVVIDATPDRVWPHVIAFQPITEAIDPLFRLGIAYPRFARIEGSGVGAVRYCEFSTGPFVEPITDWEPGRRLGFDVSSSPAPLRELSLYKNLSPPHLNGYLRSKRGEFRLVALPGGKTRLEGSTWYELEMAPEAYWGMWSDFLIHRIHDRVLEHIKLEVEGKPQSKFE